MLEFRDHTITIMGVGAYKEGSGLSAIAFLLGRAKRLIITDIKSEHDLAWQIALVKKWRAALPMSAAPTEITWRLGGHRKEDFAHADMVVRNPDVPANSPFLSYARQNHIPIENDITLFARLYGVERMAGVTGTRGKTTTSHLIYEMLRKKYPRAHMGGNVGVSPLVWLTDASAAHFLKDHPPVVLELSSFMLNNFADLKQSPHVSVFTNFYQDHLNKYKDVGAYFRDKEQIFLHQRASDILVLNADDARVAACAPKAHGRVVFFSTKKKVQEGACIEGKWFVVRAGGVSTKVAPVSVMKLRGAHNQANVLAAICAAHAMGASLGDMKAVIRAFKGVANRLELIAKKNGAEWYNDCTSTSPEAAIAALNAFPAKKIILISGGNSKGSDMRELSRTIKMRARELILVPGNANTCLPKGREVEDVREAVYAAHTLARKGDAVLFSPGLTWLPRINEFKRGELFVAEVKKL